MGINKAFGAGGVNVNPTPVLPTTTDILGMMPRGTVARPETAGMEELGGYMTPATAKVLKPAVMATGRLAGQEINAAMTGQPTFNHYKLSVIADSFILVSFILIVFLL
jgi:hypothetical protein